MTQKINSNFFLFIYLFSSDFATLPSQTSNHHDRNTIKELEKIDAIGKMLKKQTKQTKQATVNKQTEFYLVFGVFVRCYNVLIEIQ